MPPPGPAAARALEAVAHVAESFGLAARPDPAEPSQLSVRLTDAQGTEISVFVERLRADGQYFRRGGRLGLWYFHEQASGSGGPAWLLPVATAVAERLLSPAFETIADELPERPVPRSIAAVLPSSAPAPVANSGRPYGRLNVLGAEDVERFFHVDYEYEAGADVEQPPTCRIGVIYQCNQPCTFCQLAEMNTHIPPARIFHALETSRARGAQRVILTGGEPTLCRHLADYVERARELGFTTIELQTNATLLDDSKLALRLRQAGVTDAQVSLHGPDAEISDRLTAAPGTHRRTLAGVTNLLDTGVRVLLNHLVFSDNCHLLLEFVDMVERRWGRYRDRLIVQFHSPLNEFARPEYARRHIARYSDYAPQLRRAIDRARELSYTVKDLQDPTGIPALCVLGVDSAYLGAIVSQRLRPRFHRWESEWLTRVAACASCEMADACMGVPKAYVEVHGEGEFHPIRLAGKA